MQPISSGTTTERIARATLLVVLINGFAILFLWDGYVGYARDNARQLAQSLGLALDAPPAINPKLTAGEAQRLMQQVRKGADSGAVTAVLGEAAFTHAADAYYLGPGGHLRVIWDAGRVADVAWKEGIRSETDQALQRWIGLALGALGVILIVSFIRVVTTRVSLTEAGLKVRGKPGIPFATMTGLRPHRSGDTRRLELHYSLDGHEGSVKLDNYVVKKLPAIVEAICEQTGLPDPHQTKDEPSPDR